MKAKRLYAIKPDFGKQDKVAPIIMFDIQKKSLRTLSWYVNGRIISKKRILSFCRLIKNSSTKTFGRAEYKLQ